MIRVIAILVGFAFFTGSCGIPKQHVVMLDKEAPVIVYKTKSDYNNHVPVILNKDKTQIVSFPGPSDLLVNGQFVKPVRLKKGYLLDRRGINNNVAFLKYTYEEYYDLESFPSPGVLFDYIIDKDPVLEMYDCGKANGFSEDLTDEINKLIQDNFAGCIRMK